MFGNGNSFFSLIMYGTSSLPTMYYCTRKSFSKKIYGVNVNTKKTQSSSDSSDNSTSQDQSSTFSNSTATSNNDSSATSNSPSNTQDVGAFDPSLNKVYDAGAVPDGGIPNTSTIITEESTSNIKIKEGASSTSATDNQATGTGNDASSGITKDELATKDLEINKNLDLNPSTHTADDLYANMAGGPTSDANNLAEGAKGLSLKGTGKDAVSMDEYVLFKDMESSTRPSFKEFENLGNDDFFKHYLEAIEKTQLKDVAGNGENVWVYVPSYT